MENFILESIIVTISLLTLFVIPRYRKVLLDIQPYSDFKPSKRLIDIDFIKGMAISSVVLIHTCYLLLPKYVTIYPNIILGFINNSLRFAIPVFLFTSGLLLRPFIWKKKEILKFYGSKFIRIGIPYILICIILWLLGYNKSAPLWQLIVTGNMAVPFYFVIVLFQLYLIYPILDYIRKINPYLLLNLTFIISITSFFVPSTWEWKGIATCWQYLIFFVYGMLRRDILEHKISSIWRELIWLYTILQLLTVLIVQLIYYELDVIVPMNFYNFQILFGFAFIFSGLDFINKAKVYSHNIKYVFSKLGKLSLWIFLLHFPIQELIFKFLYQENSPLILEFIKNSIFTLLIVIPLAWIINIVLFNLKNIYKYDIIMYKLK
ncbi:MAG: hypothetical protein RLZZ223_146 [Candidatus Parcubacteria bacterium]|jgi:hypothetical protein